MFPFSDAAGPPSPATDKFLRCRRKRKKARSTRAATLNMTPAAIPPFAPGERPPPPESCEVGAWVSDSGGLDTLVSVEAGGATVGGESVVLVVEDSESVVSESVVSDVDSTVAEEVLGLAVRVALSASASKQ